jgi:hypothetical protein
MLKKLKINEPGEWSEEIVRTYLIKKSKNFKKSKISKIFELIFLIFKKKYFPKKNSYFFYF